MKVFLGILVGYSIVTWLTEPARIKKGQEMISDICQKKENENG